MRPPHSESRPLDVREVLATKRDGRALSPRQIEGFLAGHVAGEIPDYQASALLMAIFVRGMEDAELACWTRAMLHSGKVLSFEEVDAPKVDKHSTGGVGDKVSLPLAPAVAACGAAVPMISGRGLGHTGGTLDKLESIPGFRTDLSEDELRAGLCRNRVVFGAQTADVAPADRKLYALRDVTGLIESIPLVASSILSKKLAEGLDALVLDVKFGGGAFFPDPARGAELARVMIRIAGELGVRACAWQTSMEQPLGRAVGHALEVEESLDVLEGGGPPDTARLVTLLGGEMLFLSGLADDAAQGAARVAASLADGSAREVFARVIEQQGGDPRVVDDRARLPRAPDVRELRADCAGVLAFADCRQVGLAVLELGGGRRALEDAIDPAVGVVWERKAGERVAAGDVLALVHHRGGRGLDAALARLARAVALAEGPTARAPGLVGERIA